MTTLDLFNSTEPTLHERLTTDYFSCAPDIPYGNLITEVDFAPLLEAYYAWCDEQSIVPLPHNISLCEVPYPVHVLYQFGDVVSMQISSFFKPVSGHGMLEGEQAIFQGSKNFTVHRTELRSVISPVLSVNVTTLQEREGWEAFISEVLPRVLYDYDDEYQQVVLVLADLFRHEMSGVAIEAENARATVKDEEFVLAYLTEGSLPGEGAPFTLAPTDNTATHVYVPYECVQPAIATAWRDNGLFRYPCGTEWKMVNLTSTT